jgi:DNA-binding transcriptional MerR regulator
MFKIGDFSQLGQVSVRMLRHYDKLGLLTPSHTDKWTSYRYYTIDQLSRLNRIVALNGLGLTLQQVSELLQDDNSVSVDRLRGMLTMRKAQIAQELAEKQMQLAGVEARLRQIEQEGQPSPYEVVVKSVAPVPVASVRQVVPHASQMNYYCQMLCEQLYTRLKRLGVDHTGQEITVFHMTEFAEENLDTEAAITVDDRWVQRPPADDTIQFRELPPADLVAAVIYEGPYAEMTAAILTLLTWVGEHDHAPAGPLREVRLSGPAHLNGVLQEPAVLELQIPIVKVR